MGYSGNSVGDECQEDGDLDTRKHNIVGYFVVGRVTDIDPVVDIDAKDQAHNSNHYTLMQRNKN